MTGIAPAPPELRVSATPESPSARILRAGAQLAGTAILAGSIAGAGIFVLMVAIPLLVFVVGVPFTWLLIPVASAAGGIAGAAALVICRALDCRVSTEQVVVVTGAAVGSVPALLTVSTFFGGFLAQWWLWVGAAALAASFGHSRTLRHPLDDRRAVLVRLLFGLGLAVGASAFLPFALAPTLQGASPTALAVAGLIGLAALAISLGPYRNRIAAGLVWAGIGLLTASVVAVMLGVMLQESIPVPDAPAPPDPTVWPTDEADRDPTTEVPREAAPEDLPLPSLEDGRTQFAALAAATIEAAGPDAAWRDDPSALVQEFPCDGGSTMLVIDAEFAMGEITDSTTDEHDREVTEANLAAADRIVLAWSGLGLGTPEVMHGEPILGGADVSSVDWAKVDFAFGVAQPRVEGRCLPGR